MIIKTIKSELSSELTPLQNQIDYLKIKLDDQEQYSRRTNLKISGIKEQGRGENTDDLVLDVINNLILKHQGVSLNYSHIGRTHRVGPPPTTSKKNRPRDIIIRFISYRDRDLVFRNKKNLKSFNQRQSPDRRLYVNEALTQRRASLYKKTRDLFRNKKIKNCWTHDGKILVKSLAEKTVQITDEKDLEQFLKITVVQDPTTSYVKPSYKDALSNDNSVLMRRRLHLFHTKLVINLLPRHQSRLQTRARTSILNFINITIIIIQCCQLYYSIYLLKFILLITYL